MDLDQTVLPLIPSKKRRLVKPENRKKTQFSCDRCKTKKLACKKTNTNDESCIKCIKAGVECKVTIQRKRKAHGPLTNIGLHYKCLYILIKNLYPDIDANNIDSLINLGKSMNFKMPSPFGQLSKNDQQEIMDFSMRITSTKKKLDHDEPDVPGSEIGSDTAVQDNIKRDSVLNIKNIIDMDVLPDEKEIPMPVDLDFSPFSIINFTDLPINLPQELNIKPKFIQPDCVVIDQGNNLHYIGRFGGAGCLESCINIMINQSSNSNLWTNYQQVFHGEIVISSKIDPINQDINDIQQNKNFPYLNLLGKDEMEVYINNFFENVHPRYYCFNESKIRTNFESFSMAWLFEFSNNKILNNSEICCIYMIVILGWLHQLKNDLSVDKTKFLMNENISLEYIKIIRICISDMLISPTLDGIRCCLLYSVYMDSCKKRESGYCLLQMIARQAISIGLNRSSVHNSLQDKTLVEEMKLTWWSILKYELSFSIQMGRSSALVYEVTNLESPNIQNFKDLELFDYLNEFFKLCKITVEIFKLRDSKQSILEYDNIRIAENILNKFKDWSKSMPDHLKIQHSLNDQGVVIPPSEIKDFKIDLFFRYHYFVISLTLPYLLYYLNIPDSPVSPMQKFISQCISSSIEIAKISLIAHELKLFNGTVFQDIFYTYYASMGLVLGFVLTNRPNELINLGSVRDDILRAINIVKLVNSKNYHKLNGTFTKISKFISILLSGLNILEFSNNHDRASIKDTRSRVIHMANVSNLTVSDHFKLIGEKQTDDEFMKEILESSFLNTIL